MEKISWEEFSKVDLRVGTILEAYDFEKAQKPSYILTIDFGHLGIKKSSAQITQRYDLENLKGKQIIAVVNFPPKQIANIMSECLVLGAVEDNNFVTILTPTHTVPNGTKIG